MTNPANALAQILAAMIDRARPDHIPGFYDDVVPLDDRERKNWPPCRSTRAVLRSRSACGRRRRRGLHDAGTPLGPADLRHQRPVGRLQGEGAKTVLPAAAGAKFSFRLVPNQDPAKITAGPAALARRADVRRA